MPAVDDRAAPPGDRRRRHAEEPPPVWTTCFRDRSSLFAFALYTAGVVAALAALASFQN